MQHFIAEFKQAFSASFCEKLIENFEQDKNTVPGRVGSGVDLSKKNSIDLHISELAHWQAENQVIVSTLYTALAQYIRAFPHILIGAVTPSILDAKTGQARELKVEDIAAMPDAMLSEVIKGVFCFDKINLQKYSKNTGNFSHWHSEHFPHPKDPQQKSLHRTLLWLVYLNDVDEGGETEFLYQQARIKPSQGSLVLSPCCFTHTHRGLTPTSDDKYVLASWVMYLPAQQLYR
ncbi:2OG-Fe(II) oxygenase family protein [Colwellia sp. MEBiC06753]